MESYSVDPLARSEGEKAPHKVLTNAKENSGALDCQSGDKDFAKSKYAKQKRWKDKTGNNGNKAAQKAAMKKVKKDISQDHKKMGPQAGLDERYDECFSTVSDNEDVEPLIFASSHESVHVETVIDEDDGSVTQSVHEAEHKAEAEPQEQQPLHFSYPFTSKLHHELFTQGKYSKAAKRVCYDFDKSFQEAKEARNANERNENMVACDPMRAVRAALKNMGLEQRDVLNIFENMIILYMKLSRDKTWGDITLTLALYAKTFTRESFLAIATESLLGILRDEGTALQPQSGEPAPSWLRVLRDANTKWQLVRVNPAFEKVSKLVSICVALGICEITAFGFDLSSLSMFAESSKKVQYTATDLVGAALSTFVHFMETGYLCFETGSLKPLFYGNLDTQRFQELYQRCTMNMSYHSCGNLQKFGNIEDETFAYELEECLEMANNLSKLSVGSFERAMFLKYRDKVLSWIAEFNQSRVFGGMRVAPYTIGLFGRTAVGKSSLAHILMVYTLGVNGYNNQPEQIVTVNESDKYDSNIRSSVTGIHLDDIGNTKADFVQEATTDKIIRFCNNVPTQAVKADLAQKGKVAISPKVVVITKNVKDSCATVYSNEPTSITRRENITITVSVKSQFQTNNMLDPEKVAQNVIEEERHLPSLWELKVEQSYPIASTVEGRAPSIGWRVVDGMEKANLADVLRWIKNDSAQYFKNQRSLIDNSCKLHEKLELCSTCSMPVSMCECNIPDSPYYVQKEKLDDQAGYTIQHVYDSWSLIQTVYRATQRTRTWVNTVAPGVRLALMGVDGMLGTEAYARAQYIEENVFTHIMSRLPGYFISVDTLAHWYLMRKIMSSRFAMYCAYYALWCALFTMTAGLLYSHAYIYVLWIPIVMMCVVLSVERELLYTRIVNDRETTHRVVERFRQSHAVRVGALCVGLYAAYKVVKLAMMLNESKNAAESAYKKFSTELFGQGNLDPEDDGDIELRDLQENVWQVPRLEKMPVTHKMQTITLEQLGNKVFKNLVHITLTHPEREGRTFCTNGFFLCSNVLVIPQHVLDIGDNMKMSCVRNGSPGGQFRHILSKSHAVSVKGQDLAVVWVPSGGDWSNLVDDYITLERPRDTIATLIHKTKEGEKLESALYCQVGIQESKSYGKYFGARYNVQFPTFKGLCMSVVISAGKFPRIIGFHVAGKDKEYIGSCASPTYSELQEAVKELYTIPGTMRAMSTGTMEGSVLDVQFFEGDAIHVKSPLNFIPEGELTSFTAYGSVIGRAKTYSQVETTPMSPIVERVCGVPQMWGKPKFGVGYPWQKALMKRITPAIGVEGEFLVWAVKDYAVSLIQYIDMFPSLSREIVPLSREEIINGKVGKRFIDKMPGSTAIGYPLTGPKSRYYFEVAVPDDPRRTDCVDLPHMFWEEADRLEAIYLIGERAYPVLKACLKDEPTLCTKDKVRDFLALPVAFQILVRKYFLPIARVLSMLPLQSECAVGINAMGPEWQQMHDHVVKFGAERILAGDYKAYDLKMPAQLSQAAFSVFINIAAHFGYSSEHLCIMRGIATDLTYPLVAYNGDLISFNNTNPSGHNLTVYINCIVNSLLLRCAFCAVYGANPELKFRNVCALITYGDDCISSVSEEYPLYNHCSVAKYLSERGMEFTMPDKASDPIPYLHMLDCDFLKRKSVYHPMLRYNLGALDEMSIFKSLHSVLKSEAVTMTEQMISNLDGAAREFFCHGKDVYDRRIKELQVVATEVGVAHACRELGYTYEDRIAKWKAQYTDG
nr:MAG: RNA dependent RNA polymerase [Picornaviridae sp.]